LRIVLERTIEVTPETKEAAVVTVEAAVEVHTTPATMGPITTKENLITWAMVLPPVVRLKAALMQVLLIKGPIKTAWVCLPTSMLKTLMPLNLYLSTTGVTLIPPWNEAFSPALLATAVL
jgi:hypothetical protein